MMRSIFPSRFTSAVATENGLSAPEPYVTGGKNCRLLAGWTRWEKDSDDARNMDRKEATRHARWTERQAAAPMLASLRPRRLKNWFQTDLSKRRVPGGS